MATRRLNPEEWGEARRLYEQEGWTHGTIADYFGCATVTVAKRCADEGWKKPDKQHPPQAQARANARRKAIRQRADEEVEYRVALGTASKLDAMVGQAREEAIVEANAQEVSRVMLLHRSGATRLRETVGHLFSELQLISLRPGDLEHLVELVAKAASQDIEDERTARRAEARTIEAFQRLLGLDNRADIAKKLVDAMVRAVDLERRVYGIKDDVTEADVVKALKELADVPDA